MALYKNQRSIFGLGSLDYVSYNLIYYLAKWVIIRNVECCSNCSILRNTSWKLEVLLIMRCIRDQKQIGIKITFLDFTQTENVSCYNNIKTGAGCQLRFCFKIIKITIVDVPDVSHSPTPELSGVWFRSNIIVRIMLSFLSLPFFNRSRIKFFQNFSQNVLKSK